MAFHLIPALATSNRETCAAAQRSRPAGGPADAASPTRTRPRRAWRRCDGRERIDRLGLKRRITLAEVHSACRRHDGHNQQKPPTTPFRVHEPRPKASYCPRGCNCAGEDKYTPEVEPSAVHVLTGCQAAPGMIARALVPCGFPGSCLDPFCLPPADAGQRNAVAAFDLYPSPRTSELARHFPAIEFLRCMVRKNSRRTVRSALCRRPSRGLYAATKVLSCAPRNAGTEHF